MDNFKYLSKTTYSNFRITYPNTSYLAGFNHLANDASTKIETFVAESDGRLNYGGNRPLDYFSFSHKDEQLKRYSIEINSSGEFFGRILADNGTTTLLVSPSFQIPLKFFSLNSDEIFNPHSQLIYGDNSISLLLFKVDGVSDDGSTTTTSSAFISIGRLVRPNTDFNYFSESTIKHSYIMVGDFNNNVKIYYYSSGRRFEALKDSIYANYPLICENTNLKPRKTWLSDIIVYDSRPQIGFPYVGLIDNSFKFAQISNLEMKPSTNIILEDEPGVTSTYIPLQHTFNSKKLFFRTTLQ